MNIQEEIGIKFIEWYHNNERIIEALSLVYSENFSHLDHNEDITEQLKKDIKFEAHMNWLDSMDELHRELKANHLIYEEIINLLEQERTK